VTGADRHEAGAGTGDRREERMGGSTRTSPGGGGRPAAGARPGPAGGRPEAIWGGLNERQRTYLREAYLLDQDTEAGIRLSRARGFYHDPPASEWRWLRYGYVHDVDDPSGLALRLRGAGVERTKRVDQGTGSTWQALARRGLMETRYVPHPLVPTLLLEVRLTRLGRRVVRAAEPALAPKRRPKGALSEWQWRALARVSAAGPEGLPHRAWGGYEGVSYGTQRWLEERRGGALVEEVDPETGEPAPWGYRAGAVLRLTELGREYYAEHYAEHRALYPEVDAPAPGDHQADARRAR
jgi:hypothetical protein